MVSGGANGYYTLLKGDPEVVVAKGNLIIPRRNSTTGCSFMSYPGQIIIIVSFATDCVLAVVVAVNSSVRRVITNDHRLTECSFL